MPFTGSGVAIVTPFKNGKINFDKLGELIEFHIANSTDAIIICGTTGESAAMPDAEHISAIEYTVQKVAGRIPVVAGAGSNDTHHGVNLSRDAQRVGADALLSVTPYYNKATQKGLVMHYSAIASAVDIPIILYNVPSRTGVNMLPETLLKLSEIDNIVGVKEAGGNISQVAKIASLCGDKMAIYSGDDDMIVPVMSLGGAGVISVLANILPKETHDITAHCLAGDYVSARQIQLKLYDLIKALFIEVNPIPVKTALNLMGFDVGELRLPLCEMEEKNLAVLRAEMEKAGIALKA
ncbi:MAG: 4-hydroxy-tetrahydrodipicolinate synthase [Clostridia bacterium]|nr:4-hydroxy-tetrahydrodipicolinate synthase [Oscillospiraceae bacterium]MBQ7033322.1 4-hydroxy-tetrahydrodipicolinate synthase [Clostridia bacterium]